MYTTERRRMSLHETKRRDPVRVSAGSLWQDPLALEVGGANKGVISPRSRTRALSVVFIAVEDGSASQTEQNLSLTCLKEACADEHAVLKCISFERIALGTTEILDTFYNAGKLRHALPRSFLESLYFPKLRLCRFRCRRGGDEQLYLPAVALLSPGRQRELQYDQQCHPVLQQTRRGSAGCEGVTLHPPNTSL